LLIVAAATGAIGFSYVQQINTVLSRIGGAHPKAPALASAPEIQRSLRAELVPEAIPFLSSIDRQRVRDEYLPAPNYKALAMNVFESHFVSGLPSQDIADKAAVDKCESAKRRPSTDSSVIQLEYRCDLFASGSAVVAQPNIPMPPMPWINRSVQRPFLAAELPMVPLDEKDSAGRRYGHSSRPKAFVISPNGRVFANTAAGGPEEAMRRSLERCGYVYKAACLVVAVDDTFVTAIPTTARAVGFYRQDTLFGVQAQERAEVALRLAGSTEGWQAVAVGTGGHAGLKVGAASERAAVSGAMDDCATHDRDCHIAVIGPFLVEAAPVGAPPAIQPPPAPPALQMTQQPAPAPPGLQITQQPPPAPPAQPTIQLSPPAPPSQQTTQQRNQVPQTSLER
jgi:adenylate cyclase